MRLAIRAIAKLSLPQDLDVSFILVDNAADDETRKVFEEVSSSLHIPSRYIPETRRGIVHARNRVLREVHAIPSDYLAFLDDDDTPDPNWINHLWTCLKEHSATVAAGKMEYRWPKDAGLSSEMKGLNAYGSGSRQTGDVIRKCGVGNALIDLDFVRKHGLSFDTTFNLTGGEDTHFFELMTLKGAKIVWCNEAVIYSDVIPERATAHYILRRRYNIGYVEYKKNALLYGAGNTFIDGLWRLIKHTYKNIKDLLSGSPEKRAHVKRRTAEMRGMLRAMLGLNFEIYKDTDGS